MSEDILEKEGIFERIEWEVLKDKIVIEEKLTSLGGLPKGSYRIEVWRDESYKIRVKVYGTIDNMDEYSMFMKSLIDSKIQNFNVVSTNINNISKKYIFNRCSLENSHIGFKLNNVCFETELVTEELRIQFHTQEQSDLHIEWFLNGPDDFTRIFPRVTQRSFSRIFTRKRLSVDSKAKSYDDKIELYGPDFAFIDTGEIKYIIGRVPEGLGPEWSGNIGIEYRKEWGIPDQNTREAIAEITSFIIGRHLLKVGYSIFDSTGQPIEQVALDPWSNNVISLSQSSGLPPIRFSDFNTIEEVLNQVVPRYLELRNVLNLNKALWRYWIANDLPIGVNLPILHAGVEILANAWFGSDKSKTGGVYLPKKEFDKLIKEGMQIIIPKLKTKKYGDRMIDKMSKAYNMTPNERIPTFFEEIGLNIGEVENEALKSRNRMAHGGSRQLDEEIHFTRSYQTLFHRILLKILGYTGNYIDYSTEGWPERHIDEPLGGNK